MWNKKYVELAQTVTSWLQYKNLTGLAGLLNESSIQLPISEYLTTNTKNKIESEKAHPHPSFKKSGRGRPKQLDYVVSNGKDSWIDVYECKFQTDSPQRIIDDICRLMCLQQVNDIGNPSRLFLFAGEHKGGEEIPLNINSDKKRMSIFDGIFEFKIENKAKKLTVKIKDLSTKQSMMFAKFSNDYGIMLPEIFDTILCGYSRNETYSCYIWKILNRAGSKHWIVDKNDQLPEEGDDN